MQIYGLVSNNEQGKIGMLDMILAKGQHLLATLCHQQYNE